MSRLVRGLLRAQALWAPLLLLTANGCGQGTDTSLAGGAGGAGGGGGAPPGPSSLHFDPDAALQVAPGDVATLELSASPPGVYHVRFGMLGAFKDASLDKSEADTDASGRVPLTVTAPSSPTTFTVRASVGDSVSTTLGVSVSSGGFATLQVTPNYAGARTPSYWLASVRSGTTCADLSGQAPSDGDLKGSAVAGKIPQVEGVPVGPALAVTLRGAYSVYGCLDVTELTAGEINKVTIDVADLPMQLGDTNLELTLGLDPPKNNLAPTLGANSALDGLGPDDMTALLDLMSASSDDTQAFEAARQAGSWDQTLDSSLGPNALRNLVSPWIAGGVAALPAAETFRGKLVASGKLPGYAYVELSSIAGMDVSKLGLGSQFLATWQADPDDTVLLGSSLRFMPSRLIAALALGPAQNDAPGAASVPEAMATLLSCDAVSSSLVAQGTGNDESYSGCDAACTRTLCETALTTLWQSVADASGAIGAPQLKLVITASGAALVDDQARPTSFSGTWVGTLSVGQQTNNVGGPAAGAPPPPPG